MLRMEKHKKKLIKLKDKNPFLSLKKMAAIQEHKTKFPNLAAHKTGLKADIMSLALSTIKQQTD